MKTLNHVNARGLTLIELMVTVAIIGIIAAVAFPAYEKQAQKSRRADGIALLMDAAARQERFVIDNPTIGYTTAVTSAATDDPPGLGLATADSQKGYYALSVTLAAVAGDPPYILKATAQNGQDSDFCKTLTLTSTGVRSGTDSSGAALTTCW